MNHISGVQSRSILVAGMLAVQMTLASCGGDPVIANEAPVQPASAAASAAPQALNVAAPVEQVCADCGTVASIITVREEGQSSGVGAAIGALVGGLAGHQVGGGNGKRIATAVGVVGGAFAGNKIEKNRNSSQLMEVVVAMDNGGERRIRVYDTGSLTIGSKVRVQGDTILPR